MQHSQEAAFELFKVGAVDVVAVHHVAVASYLDRLPAEFSDAGSDALLQLHEGENVHESGLVGVVGAEAHVHA